MEFALGAILIAVVPGLIIWIMDRWFKGQEQKFKEVKEVVGAVDKKVDDNHKELSDKLDENTKTLHKRVTSHGNELARHDERLNNLEE